MFKLVFILLLTLSPTAIAADNTPGAIKAKKLIGSAITGVDSHEVLISEVSIKANTVAARHFHPTEEYLYVLSGETILRIDGEEDQFLTTSMYAKIPAKAVHTAVTKDSDVKLIVFRVHPKGLPVRKLVDK